MARGYDLTNEKDTKDYLRDVEIEYTYQCYDQKEADGCHRLAEFRENVRKNVESAVGIYKENCDERKHPKSCYKYALCLFTGNGLVDKKPDAEGALQYFDRSCELSHPAGCELSGQLHMTNNNVDKGVQDYTRGCELKDSSACYKLSGHYLSGSKVDKDLTKAFQLSKEGCELNHPYCCGNLSLMYKHGHGTQKDSQLSRHARAKAVRLQEEMKKQKQQVQVNG